VRNKKTLKIIFLLGIFLLLVVGYVLFALNRSNHYFLRAKQSANLQDKRLLLEKSVQLYPNEQNLSYLADTYISLGSDDLAEKIMVGRGEVNILNKLGNLYLSENKIPEAENTFGKGKDNRDSLKGLILAKLKRGDRGEAEGYLSRLQKINPVEADCYASFLNLSEFKKAQNYYSKIENCDLPGLEKYFSEHKEGQNPYFLKLEAANQYYAQNYLKLAENDDLALLKEKGDYRDAYLLATKIYAKMGDQTKSDENKQKALKIDPAYTLN